MIIKKDTDYTSACMKISMVNILTSHIISSILTSIALTKFVTDSVENK